MGQVSVASTIDNLGKILPTTQEGPSVTLSLSAGLFDIRPDNLGYFEHLIDILKY